MRAAHRRLRPARRGRPQARPLSLPLLLLWDIDGTLLRDASREHAEALLAAVHDVHGIDVRGVPVDAAGRTDRAIVRSLLEATGAGAEAIDRGAEEVLAATCAAYEPPDLAAKVVPGIAELLPRLASRREAFRFSLVTGNYERVARVKLAAAGIGRWFEEGQGGFGSDAEAREALPAIARGRAGTEEHPWPRERTVVIGDTPRDIACARADGVRVVAVTTGPYGAEAVADADAVVADAEELEAVLAGLV